MDTDRRIKDLHQLISFAGTTTAIGGAGGATLVCSDLPNTVDYDGNEVIITSGTYKGQTRGISGTTLAGVVTPATNFEGQVAAGTSFVIVGIRTAAAVVTDLEKKLDALVVVRDAVAEAGSTNQNIVDATLAGLPDYNGQTVVMTSGACIGQVRIIDQATNAAGGHVHVSAAFDAVIAVGDTFSILAIAGEVTAGIAAIEAKLDLGVGSGTFIYLDAGGEQVAFTITPPGASNLKIGTIWLDLSNLAQNSIVRLKHQIDGANYRTFETFNWTTGMDDGLYFRSVDIANGCPLQVTMQETADEGANRNVPYYYTYEVRP